MVFTNDRIGVRIINKGVKSAYDLVKIKNQSCKRSHECDGNGVGKIRTFPLSDDSAYNSIVYDLVKTRLLESEAVQVEE